MTMKRIIHITILTVLALSCTVLEKGGKISIYDDSGATVKTVTIDGQRQTVDIKVSAEGRQWNAMSPTADKWLTCFASADDLLTVSVSDNSTDKIRSSKILLVSGENKMAVEIVQDYIKILEFYTEESVIDASDGRYSVPVKINIPVSDVMISVGQGCDWLSDPVLEKDKLWFTALANPSTTESRTVEVELIGQGKSAVTMISQVAMFGEPYYISLAGADFVKYPVYDIFDPVSSERIGRVCKEYLHATDTLDASLLVAYPVNQGKIDYSKGLMPANGGTVAWGSKGISLYEPGTELSSGQTFYRKAGSTSFTSEVLTGGEVVSAVVKPLTCTDERSGAEDNHGNTSEKYTYPVVKIGTQFWMKENLKTSRQSDGTPIKTNVDKPEWVECISPVQKPICLVSGTGTSTTFLDANDPAGAGTRDKYGCLYDFAAIIGRDITLPEGKAASFDAVDRISPEGWKVPTPEEFETLYYYVCQSEYASYTKETEAELPKFLTSGNNISGFSGIGSRQRGPTGGYNAVLYYSTMGYSYTGSGHVVSQFRLREGEYSHTASLTMSSATYLRLLKKDNQ